MLNMQSDISLVYGTLPVRIPTQFTVAIFDAVFSVFHSGRRESESRLQSALVMTATTAAAALTTTTTTWKQTV